MTEAPLSLAPFPPLRWDNATGAWIGEAVLPEWDGFRIGRKGGGAASAGRRSGGTAELVVLPPEYEDRAPPRADQAQAFRHLAENQEVIRDSVAKAALGEALRFLPRLKGAGALRSRMELDVVRVFAVTKDGFAYVGLGFECTWYPGHGFGVMLHRGRIVASGNADAAELDWIARQDAESSE
jgi:hypothetical protein